MAAVGQARLTVLPHEAVLLNSLRKLLSVVPQTEYTIAKWAGGASAAPPTPSSAHPGSPPRQGHLHSAHLPQCLASPYEIPRISLSDHSVQVIEQHLATFTIAMHDCHGEREAWASALSLEPLNLLPTLPVYMKSRPMQLAISSFSPSALQCLSLHGAAGAREMTGLGTERMPSGSEGPELGAQFAQLVKELRSEYAGAVTACAARIAQGVFGPSGRSILRILEQHGIAGTPTLMQQQVHAHAVALNRAVLPTSGRLSASLSAPMQSKISRGHVQDKYPSGDLTERHEANQEG